MNNNLLGRLTALALILGVAYGVHTISRGGLGCPLGDGSCCVMETGHDHQDADAPKNAPAPAKNDDE